jgi:hypothetical protein
VGKPSFSAAGIRVKHRGAWHTWRLPQRSSRVLRRQMLTGATMPTSARACRPQRTFARWQGLRRPEPELQQASDHARQHAGLGHHSIVCRTRTRARHRSHRARAPIAPHFSTTPVPVIWERLARDRSRRLKVCQMGQAILFVVVVSAASCCCYRLLHTQSFPLFLLFFDHQPLYHSFLVTVRRHYMPWRRQTSQASGPSVGIA